MTLHLLNSSAAPIYRQIGFKFYVTSALIFRVEIKNLVHAKKGTRCEIWMVSLCFAWTQTFKNNYAFSIGIYTCITPMF